MTHAFAAVALGQTLTTAKLPRRFWALAMISSLLPDADVLGFGLGVEYGDRLGHRGLSHSITFALAWSFGALSLVDFQSITRGSRTWWKLIGLLFAVTASHGVLDALTNGGLGVAFFAPFDDTRYFFPWRPLVVSPISFERFFTSWGGAVLQSEFKFIWLPLSMLWLAVASARKILR
jgi:inner membrane protein